MKVAIFGAGQMGRVIGYRLVQFKDVEVTFFDNDVNNLKRAGETINNNFTCINKSFYHIRPDDLVGFDVIVSALPYHSNLEAAKLAMFSGVSYCDLGGSNEIVAKQFELNDGEFKDCLTGKNHTKKDVLIIPDCGLAPGLANILAYSAVMELGGKANDVEIRVGGIPYGWADNAFNYFTTWSVSGLINEYLEPAKIIENGEVKVVESLEGYEYFQYNYNSHEEYEAFYTSGGISTLCETLAGRVKNMDYKTIRYRGHCNIIRALKQLGLFGEHRKLIEEKLQSLLKMKEHDMDRVLISVDVCNSEHTFISYRSVIDYDYELKQTAMAKSTGYSAAAVAYMIGTKQGIHPDAYGVKPAETVLDCDMYLNNLCSNDSDIVIHKETNCITDIGSNKHFQDLQL